MGKREIICLSLHCHHQNDCCIKMGRNESHFNILLTVRDIVILCVKNLYLLAQFQTNIPTISIKKIKIKIQSTNVIKHFKCSC